MTRFVSAVSKTFTLDPRCAGYKETAPVGEEGILEDLPRSLAVWRE